MSAVPDITLNDGNTIPQLGFWVFQIDPAETAAAVGLALQAGSRHIDTAEMYVDLFLIHWPLPTRYDGDFVSTWKVLEEVHQAGQARSIGVSNFQVAHLERLAAETGTVPAVNQIEVHPYLANDEVRAYGAAHGIATEAWSPIAQGGVLDDPAITAIVEKVGLTPAQVTLRWHIQRGDIIFPFSSNDAAITENFALFYFELSQQDVDAITALDKGEAGRTGPNPDEF